MKKEQIHNSFLIIIFRVYNHFLVAEDINKTMSYFISSSKDFLEKSQKYIPENIISYDRFDSDTMDVYVDEIKKGC